MAASAAVAATPVMSFPLEMNSDKEVTETVSGKTYSVRGRHADNMPAVVGNGLRTDGYSSYVQVPMANYTLSDKTLSIAFWTACQTYPMMQMDAAANKEGAIISCLDETNKKGFAFYLYSQGAYGFSCYVNGEKKSLSVPALFPQYEWVHLCATIDLNANAIKLYQNGTQVASLYAQGAINLPTGNLFIGKSFKDEKSGQIFLNTYNGIIDELTIYNETLTPDDISNSLNSLNLSNPSMSLPARHFHSDITRPRHHAMPASNWMNESHGMTYSDGRYHLFFQKNGNGPYMSRLHWGHVSSADLCNWTEERIAIVPGKNYDMKGCWSGCVFTDETITQGQPWILYTGVDNARATINLATPNDSGLVMWTKNTQNPVVNGTPSGYSADFRDPYFFRSGDNAYCIVGTSRGGIASTSLHKYNAATGVFDYTGLPFFTGANAAEYGTFFEMPNVTPMGNGQWLFTVTPLGSNYGVRTIYMVGTIAADGTFHTSATPKTVELPGLAKEGYGLLSPTILQKDGKTIVLGIVPDKLSQASNLQVGWAHTLSFPREWSIDAQGELIQKPYEGLQALRSDTSVTIDPQTLNGELSLAPVSGQEIEVEATFTVGTAPFGIKILQNENGNACKIYFEPATGRFVVDFSAVGHKNNDSGIFDGVYASALPATVTAGETMKLHIFFDHSVLDVFINDRWASSVRIFPTSANATGVSLFAEGETTLREASAWTMLPSAGDISDGIEDITGVQASTHKVLQDGQIVIFRGDNRYSVTGQLLY